MNKYKKRTLFLYYDPHYFHEALAKALHADFYPAPKLRSEKGNIIWMVPGRGTQTDNE